MVNTVEERETLRRLLCLLGDAIRSTIIAARAQRDPSELAEIAAETPADTIYRIDRIGEDGVFEFLDAHWPRDLACELVMEGLDDEGTARFPRSTPLESTRWKVILDPIDGTRGLMHDKRSAWVLAAAAPQRGRATAVSDLEVAAMTELPVTKQDLGDQISGVRGCGPNGVVSERMNVRTHTRQGHALRPSQAETLLGGFASLVRFFPEGKALTAEIEEDLFRQLFEFGHAPSPRVFEDQYPSTGGQIYELLAGRDRMLADIRPLVFAKLGMRIPLTCHPYDICTSFLLEEMGGVVESPSSGGRVRVPLDTTSPVAWIGYANERLAESIGPLLRSVLARHGLI